MNALSNQKDLQLEGRKNDKGKWLHLHCFLSEAVATASDDDSLPRLIGDISHSPGRLWRKELAEGSNGLVRHIPELLGFSW
jgi:hypothetical protein